MGRARDRVIAHELAHHLVWWWQLDVVNEEAFADAFAIALLSNQAQPTVRAQQSHAVQVDQPNELHRPLNHALIAVAVCAA